MRKKICSRCGDKGKGPRGKGLIESRIGVWLCEPCVGRKATEAFSRLGPIFRELTTALRQREK